MARFEKIQALYDLFSRTREPQPMTALCTELGVSRATANRLIAFLRDERGLDIRYETEQRGYRLQRRPHDAAAVSLLGMGGAEAAAHTSNSREEGIFTPHMRAPWHNPRR